MNVPTEITNTEAIPANSLRLIPTAGKVMASSPEDSTSEGVTHELIAML